MASFEEPKITNPILSDVASINALLVALAKLDPSTQEGIQNGMIRLQEGGEGYVFEKFNGNSWERMEQFNLDAQSVDGKSASATAQADTIPVRDKDGKLAGDITGNAATATSAKALSEVNPVAKGGTGAATAEQARTNLGVPPTNHANTATTYGLATDTKYGHVKLSDATNGTAGVSGGTAATPAAVKAAMDKANTAQTNLSKYLPLAGGTMTGNLNFSITTDGDFYSSKTQKSYTFGTVPTTGSLFGIRHAANGGESIGIVQAGITKDGETFASLHAFDMDSSSHAYSSLGISYPKGGTPYTTAPTPPDASNDTQIATTAWVKKQITANPSMPVGAIYVQYGSQSEPSTLFGGTWQDVSSTYAGRFFRVVGEGTAAFGENQEGGAPNISGTVWFDGATVYEATASTSCFYQASTKRGHPYGGGSARGDLGFSAQRSNTLYGAATEIRPINHTIRIWKRTA